MHTYLLHLGCCALEELDIAGANELSVLGERLDCFILRSEQYEGISSGPAVSLMHEQDALLPIHHICRLLATREKLQLQNTRKCYWLTMLHNSTRLIGWGLLILFV